MTTTSSQRSNFQPAAAIVPTWREAERAVHADRAGVGRVADHGEHLARAGGLAARQQLGQEQPAEAAAGRRRRRGRPSPRGRSDRPGAAGTGWRRRSRSTAPSRSSDEPGQALGEDVVAAPRHLGHVGRIELEGAGAVAHVPAVDRGDGGEVVRRCSGGSGRGRMAVRSSCARVYNARFFAGSVPLMQRYITMVVIRLARGGAKKRPFFNIVVADSRTAPRRPLHRARRFLQPGRLGRRAAAARRLRPRRALDRHTARRCRPR